MLSLGCAKNLVDSESILDILRELEYDVVEEVTPDVRLDLAVVNTCGFIQEAKQESIDTILQLAKLKESGQIKYIIAAGCLGQRYQQELVEQLPEVDAFLGTGNLPQLKQIIKDLGSGQKKYDFKNPGFLRIEPKGRRALTPGHLAYVKIAEGCNNRCHYCVIPDLRGPYRSRPLESVVEEVKVLAQNKTAEVNLISQDTGYYGYDLHGKSLMPDLLKSLEEIKSLKWIRLLYTHPAHVTDELITQIARSQKVCKYIDLPLQHINDNILQSMGRKVTKQQILDLIVKLRSSIPGLAIRTTFIVGLPGEGDKEFQELLDFIRATGFERLGAFMYSQEEGTPAADYKHQVAEEVKQKRFDEVMSLQQDIARELNSRLMGKTIPVLIDNKIASPVFSAQGYEKDTRTGWFLGRTQADAPEVDGQVFVKVKDAVPGQILEVEITDTYEYDLVGKAIRSYEE